jgi:membrane associated rhomboid family serine protease
MTSHGRRPDTTRMLLGAAVVALAAGWAWSWSTGDGSGAAGVLGRSAAILGAVWLTYPRLRQLGARTWAVLGTAVVVTALRPRAAWITVPVVLALGLGLPRRHRTAPPTGDEKSAPDPRG